MNVPVWQIVSWPRVAVPPTTWKTFSRFELLGWNSQTDQEGRCIGSTLWAAKEVEGYVGLAWDWWEMRPNVIVMSDPMNVLSNVVFEGLEQRKNDFKRMVYLNNAIYHLPWQRQLRALVRPRVRQVSLGEEVVS